MKNEQKENLGRKIGLKMVLEQLSVFLLIFRGSFWAQTDTSQDTDCSPEGWRLAEEIIKKACSGSDGSVFLSPRVRLLTV